MTKDDGGNFGNYYGGVYWIYPENELAFNQSDISFQTRTWSFNPIFSVNVYEMQIQDCWFHQFEVHMHQIITKGVTSASNQIASILM